MPAELLLLHSSSRWYNELGILKNIQNIPHIELKAQTLYTHKFGWKRCFEVVVVEFCISESLLDTLHCHSQVTGLAQIWTFCFDRIMYS